MSSWNTNISRKRIRFGYHQLKPLGTFTEKSLPATVVSAYYEMPSKYPKDHYRIWIKCFLEHCSAHIIFFCEEELKPFIETCRQAYPDRTSIQVLPRSQWISNTKFSQLFWDSQHTIDPEKAYHSPDLYKVWYEKKEFVKRAILLNPWNHTDFVWADAGILRSKELCSLIKDGFPHANRIPTDRMLLSNVGEFTEKDSIVRTINGVEFRGDTSGKMRIDAKVIAGSSESWKQYDILYDSILDKYRTAKLFLGKEQTIMATLVLEHSSFVSLVEPKPIGPEFWYYLILWLGVVQPLFTRMNSDATNMKRHSYADLLKLMPNNV